MIPWSAYARLMRLDKPIGILLLWYPTAWALWVANQGAPSILLFGIFLLGTVLMRSAGCVVNDIADREFDKHVKRTKNRPLTSGEITLKQAMGLFCVLLMAAASLLWLLPMTCFYLSLVALLFTVIYPFCKRYIQAPQFVLGLVFSMGIPMAFYASNVSFDTDAVLLYLINSAWIISYDTMYAMADKPDDMRIGVKSTAIYFGSFDKSMIGLLQMCYQGLWLFWASFHVVSFGFYLCWLIGLAICLYQQHLITHRDPASCFKGFIISHYYGLVMWVGVMQVMK